MHKLSRILVTMLVVVMAVSTAWATAEVEEAGESDEPIIIELWGPENATGTTAADSPHSAYLQQEIGVGYERPRVPWEGGTAYLQRLNLRLAEGKLPDMFVLYGGIEADLIPQGALADLTDLLPQYAPDIWANVPDAAWDVVRAASPDGESVYFLPMIGDFPKNLSYIRQDWLDRVGMTVPTTKDEYLTVLRAFRDQDANGNGDPNDEIPVTGRQGGRWMDHLYLMFGAAVDEGYPEWDMYDGEVTYAGVTNNMREAILFLRQLYEERLLDQEVFLNSRQAWMQKLYGDKAGTWFWDATTPRLIENNVRDLGMDPVVVLLPPPEVEGFEGFFAYKPFRMPYYAFASKDRERLVAALQLANWMESPETLEERAFGLPGIDHEVQNGRKVSIESDPNTVGFIANNVLRTAEVIEYNIINSAAPEEIAGAEHTVAAIYESIPYGKLVASSGLPASVYEGYPDLRSHTMFQECLAKIVIGEWPIERFDEFVEEWYAVGGDVVTERVRAWYAKVSR